MTEPRRSADWDLANAVPNFTALLASQSASLVLGVVISGAAIRILGVDGYGEFAGAVAAVQTVHLIAINWTSLSVLKLGCEEFLTEGSIARTFWARLAILAVNYVAVVLAAPLWLPLLSHSLRVPEGIGPLIIFSVLLAALATQFSFALQAVKLPRANALASLSEKVWVGTAMLAAAASGLRLGVAGVFIIYLAGQCIVACVSARIVYPLISGGWPPEMRRCREIVAFSWPLVPVALCGYLTTSALDILFIARHLERVDVAHYAAAFQLTSALVQAPSLAGSLILPFLLSADADGHRAKMDAFLRDALPVASLAWSVGCAGSYFILRPLFLAITGAGPDDATKFLWPMLAASAATAPVLLAFGPLTNSHGETRIATGASFLMATTNLALNAALIPRWGLEGCAWASAAASFATTFFWMRSTMKFFPDAAWARLSFLASLPALAGAAASLAFDDGSPGPLIAVAAASVPLARTIGARVRPALGLFVPKPAQRDANIG